MRACLAGILLAGVASPTFADKKLDPDPAFLAKARTAATAKVEAHYDISEKAPFAARFMVCAGQLSAARDEGRVLPLPRADLDRLIADYRNRAIELQAYRTKSDAKAAAAEIDGQIAKIVSGTMSYLPADTTRLGVDRMKVLHGERLAFCQLTRDWYEVQNGIRTAASPEDRKKFAKANEEAMRQSAANAPKPPMPPAIAPAAVKPIAPASAPAAPPIPTVKSSYRRPARPPAARMRATCGSAPTSQTPVPARHLPAGRCGRRSPNAPRGWT